MKQGVLFLLLLLVLSTESWMGLIKYDPQEFKENNITDAHCFSMTTGRLTKGQRKPVKHLCAVAHCSKDRSIRLTGCGAIGVAPPCYIVPGNLSNPFPDCCNKVFCPDDSN